MLLFAALVLLDLGAHTMTAAEGFVLAEVPYAPLLALLFGLGLYLMLGIVQLLYLRSQPDLPLPDLALPPGRQPLLWQLRFLAMLGGGLLCLWLNTHGALRADSFKEVAIVLAAALPLIPAFMLRSVSGVIAPQSGWLARWDSAVPGLQERRQVVAAWLWTGGAIIGLATVLQIGQEHAFFLLIFLYNVLPLLQLAYAFRQYRLYQRGELSERRS
jgi:hypothetical protein